MDTTSAFDIISFIASIASLILAIGAIWLSVVFYRMSSEASKSTTEAAKGIAASVERLEKLFDKLYSDTFSMMKDTVTDMRKHIWPVDDNEQEKVVEEAEKKTDERIGEVRKLNYPRQSRGPISGAPQRRWQLMSRPRAATRSISSGRSVHPRAPGCGCTP